MQYTREQVMDDIDIIEVTEAEYQQGNKMFIDALKNKFPDLDVNKIKYNTVIITDGLYRMEFKVKKIKD